MQCSKYSMGDLNHDKLLCTRRYMLYEVQFLHQFALKRYDQNPLLHTSFIWKYL